METNDMKKTILLYILLGSTLSSYAQNENRVDSLITEVSDSQSVVDVNSNIEVELLEASKTIEEQKEHLLELRDVESKLAIVNREKEELQRKLTAADERVTSIERSLITMASNFLYIPYEAYGVEEIAIKAFESVQSPELKKKYQQRYILLKNYQQHLKDFRDYLVRVQKACNGTFQATATEFIDDPTVSPSLVLKKQLFYIEYVKYDGYKDTFIGGLILKTEAILRAHTKQKRANLQGVIETIEKTQDLTVPNTIEEVIDVVDQRLKTVEDL